MNSAPQRFCFLLRFYLFLSRLLSLSRYQSKSMLEARNEEGERRKQGRTREVTNMIVKHWYSSSLSHLRWLKFSLLLLFITRRE
jgi:hypothetical protein